MNQIQNSIQQFRKVSLADLDRVKLMNRIDQKFCLHRNQLPAILDAIQSGYSILEIDGKTIFEYDNTYFDTTDNQMFLWHHNGKLNRFKIRMRKYVQSDQNFLEIKCKNNKGRTVKNRIEKQYFKPEFTSDESNFITISSPFSGIELEPKINNFFHRITLVNNSFTERVTLDISPEFRNRNKKIVLENLIIVEIKQDKSSESALITRTLRALKISNHGFSKYCIGRALLEDEIKKNNFKPLLLKIRKEFYN